MTQIEETDEYLLAEALDTLHNDVTEYTQLGEATLRNIHLVAEYFVKHTDLSTALRQELEAQLKEKETYHA